MEQNKFYEILKFLVYLFETNPEKRKHGLLPQELGKAKTQINELCKNLFNAEYVVLPHRFIIYLIAYDRDIHEIARLNSMFKKLELVRENLPQGSDFDVLGLMNDISQNISQFTSLALKKPQGMEKELKDFLGPESLKSSEASQIVEFHKDRLKSLEKASSDSPDSSEAPYLGGQIEMMRKDLEDLISNSFAERKKVTKAQASNELEDEEEEA